MTNDPYEVEPAGSIDVTKLAAYVKGFRMPGARRREGMHGGRRPKSLEGGKREGVCAGGGVSLWGSLWGFNARL